MPYGVSVEDLEIRECVGLQGDTVQFDHELLNKSLST